MSMFTREDAEARAGRNAVEGEIREFVRRDAANLRRQPDEGKTVADNISTLLQRVAVNLGAGDRPADQRLADAA